MSKIRQPQEPTEGRGSSNVVRLAEWTGPRPSQNATTTATATIPTTSLSPRDEVATIRSYAAGVRQQQEVAKREENLRRTIEIFHTLAMNVIPMYGVDRLGFRMPTDSKAKIDTVQREFEKLDAEREVGMLKNERIHIETPQNSPSTYRDPRIQGYANMHRKHLFEQPDGRHEIARTYPILHNLCPTILANRGLIERLLKIQKSLIENMESFYIGSLDVRIRGTDPQSYQQEMYNFFRHFDRSPDREMTNRIQIIHESSGEEESVFTKPDVDIQELDAMERRARTMKIIFALQHGTQRRAAMMIRKGDVKRTVPLSVLRLSEITDGATIVSQEAVMEYLRHEHDISVISAGQVIY